MKSKMLFTPHLFAFLESAQRQSLTTPSWGGQKLCLVPRGQCSFRRIKIAGRHKKALQAAEFRVRQESDLNENKFIIIPDDDGQKASVWGFKTQENYHGRYVPESLAVIPQNEGTRLVTLRSGYEGQIWDQGHLIASRWWSKTPGVKNWTSFLYSVAGDHDVDIQALPEPQTLAYRTDFPIFEIDKERTANLLSPVNLGRILLIGLGCGFLFISGQYSRNLATLNSVENKVEQLSPVTAQISSERRRAIANSRQIQKYNVIGHQGTFFLGLGDLSKVFDKKGLAIEKITLSSEEIEVRLQSSDEIDVPTLVATLEAKPSLGNVNIGLAVNNRIIMTADLIAPFDYQNSVAVDGDGG